MTWNELKGHALVVYSTKWCADCHRLKQHLDSHSVNYTEVDIDEDSDAAERLRKATGRSAIPFLEVDSAGMVRGWHDGKPGKWDEETFLREIQETLDS